MKKIISIALVLCLLFSMGITASAAPRTEKVDITYRAISIVLDGKEITPCDAEGNTVEPFIMNGTTYLPLRAIAQAMGLGVAWDGKTNTVTLTSGGEVITGAGAPGTTKETKSVTITYRDIKVILDGVQLELVNAAGDTVEPFILDGTTYLPLRIVGEALDLGVSWDSATSTVGVKQPEVKPEEPSEGEWLVSLEKYSDSEGYGFSHEFSYYDNGLLDTSILTNSDGIVNTEMYDEEGRLVYGEYESAGIISSEMTRYGDNGRVESISHCYIENDVESNYVDVYSWNGDVATVTTYFEGETEGYPSHTVTESYDANGNLLKKYTDYDGFFIHYDHSYDQWGNLVYSKYSDSDGITETFTWSYDAKGNLLSESIDTPYISYTISYTYDANGNEIYNKYVGTDGTSETWYTYNADGKLAGGSRKDNNGTVETMVVYYNAKGQQEKTVTNITYGDGSTETVNETFTYDENGNVIKLSSVSDSGYSLTIELEYVFIGG